MVDDMSSGRKQNLNSRVEFYEADIRDAAMRDVFRTVRPEVVFHTAAQMSVSVSARDPMLDAEVNVMGTLNLLDAMRSSGGGKMVFASTGGAMYGAASDLPTPETSPSRPGSPYGASKLAVENYLPVYRELYGIDFSILRPANVYGPRQNPHGEAGVVAIFTKSMLTGGAVRIFGDGEDTRDYVYVDDVVRAMLLAGERGGTGPYNVGTGRETSVNELAGRLSRLTGYACDPVHAPARPGDLRRASLACDRAKKELGWSSRTSLDAGLSLTAEWFVTETRAARLRT